jgi:uncharacterized protein
MNQLVRSARLVGIISDTHGLLRPEALDALGGSELILHAGDVGSGDVLERLSCIAPVVVVRGNVDTGVWASKLPITAELKVGECRIGVLHNIAHLKSQLADRGLDMVVYGHSHKPDRQVKEGVVYLNPGSAGPRRFRLPVSLIRADFGVNPPAINFIDLLTGERFVP